MRRTQRFNREKFKELLLYVAFRCELDPDFGSTKLNKILFYADFLSFHRRGKPITGARYQKLPKGPAPRAYLPVVQELLETGDCVQVERQRMTKTQKRLVAKRPGNAAMFNGDEIAIVDEVIAALTGRNATSVSEISHDFIGWQLAGMNEDIPYETVYLGTPGPLSASEIEYGRELAASEP